MSANPYLPPAPADGSALTPAEIAAYHPSLYNRHHCAARRPKGGDGKDRRWIPFVYIAFQCKKAPVSGTDLCATCTARKDTYALHNAAYALDATPANARKVRKAGWNGRVNESPDMLPATSRMMGGPWFRETKPTWAVVEKPPTPRQAAARLLAAAAAGGAGAAAAGGGGGAAAAAVPVMVHEPVVLPLPLLMPPPLDPLVAMTAQRDALEALFLRFAASAATPVRRDMLAQLAQLAAL